MNKNGKIISNSILLILSNVTGKILRFVLIIFAARILGDANYGKFSFALAFTSLFLILSDGGIHQLLIREIARWPDKAKKYIGNAFFIKVIFSFFALIIMLSAAYLTKKPQDVLLTVYIISFAQIIASFSLFFKSIFQAFQKMKYDAISTVIGDGLTASLGIILLVMGGNYIGLSYMYLIANTINLIFCVWITKYKIIDIEFDLDKQLIKFFIKEGFPFGVLFFFAIMYTYIDTVMLSFMKGDEAVGWYNAAYRLIFAVLFVATGTMEAVFPVLSEYYQASMSNFKQLFEKVFKTMFIIGFSLASLIFLISNRLILFLYGNTYINASSALKILVWSTALIFITTTMTHTTRASNHQRFTAKVVAGGAVLNIFLNFILIPKYSFVGAALATLITEASTFLFHFIFLSKFLVKPPLFKLLPKVILINVIMGLYVLIMIRINILILIVTSLLINMGMLLITKYFSKEEIAVLKENIKISGAV